MEIDWSKGFTWVYAAFCLSFVLILLVSVFKTTYANEINDHGIIKKYRYNKFLVFLFFFPLAFISSCRTYFIDTADYILMYKYVGTDLKNIDFTVLTDIEHGYLYFTALLNRISSDPQILFIITSVIIFCCFFIFIIENSEDVAFSLMIFLCVTWTNTMNGMRQYVVAGILCVAWTVWAKSTRSLKNDFILILLVLLSMQFHRSAIICAIVFLISRGKFLNIGIILSILATLLIFAVPSIYHFIFEAFFASDSYGEYENINASMGIMRFLVCCVPIVLITYYKILYPHATKDEHDIFNWMMNICIFSFCFSILALKMVFFARLDIYFGIFSVVMIPNLINRTTNGKYNIVIKIIAFILYFIYFFFQMDAYGGYMTSFRLCFLDD